MSAIVLEAVRQPHTDEGMPSRPVGRPNLVLVPTGRASVRTTRAARAPMRLTRFGRLVVSLSVAAVVAILAVGLAGQLASATGESHTVTVRSGQTLSGIAARELPELTRAEGVVELQVTNGLSSSHVHAGQQLVVPAR